MFRSRQGGMLQLKSVIVALYFLAYVSKPYLQLVEAFQATLEEVVEADFLLVSLQHISLCKTYNCCLYRDD